MERFLLKSRSYTYGSLKITDNLKNKKKIFEDHAFKEIKNGK